MDTSARKNGLLKEVGLFIWCVPMQYIHFEKIEFSNMLIYFYADIFLDIIYINCVQYFKSMSSASWGL